MSRIECHSYTVYGFDMEGLIDVDCAHQGRAGTRHLQLAIVTQLSHQ